MPVYERRWINAVTTFEREGQRDRWLDAAHCRNVRPMSTVRSTRGALFDLGSVLVRVDIDDVDRLADSVGCDQQKLFAVLVGDYAADTDHPFQRAERGEITLTAALDDIEVLANHRGFSIGAIRAQLLEPAVEVNTALVDEVAQLRSRGWRTGVVTNSVLEYSAIVDGLLPYDQLFDCLVDSCRVGVRKPDVRIFRRALDLLGLEPDRVLFVDDQPGNVAAAAGLGMRTLLAEQFDTLAGDVRNDIDAWVANDPS